MNYNTFLTLFGFSSDDFKEIVSDPIKDDDNSINLYVEQRTDINRICPFCNSNSTTIKDYDEVSYSLSLNPEFKYIIHIRKVRFKCKLCKRTYTPEIANVSPHNSIPESIKNAICNEFFYKITFIDIARKYNVSSSTIINIFDSKFSFVPRGEMPTILCIDEVHFSSDYDQNYCCVLVDMQKKTIVDIIRNRKKEYLDEYFSKIPVREREKVKYFVSDLYDEYRIVRRKYFKNATHVADRFHIVIQLTRAISKRRVMIMNSVKNTNRMLYNFMKKNWELFEKSKLRIPNKTYKSNVSMIIYTYDDLFAQCLKMDHDLSLAYDILQQIIMKKFDRNNMDFSFFFNIADMLENCEFIEFKKVASTYRKWIKEISNAYTKYALDSHISNSMAEQINNQIKTIIKISNGLVNFDRFRRRAIILSTSKKGR